MQSELPSSPSSSSSTPCSPSILLNPLPLRRAPSVIVTHTTSAPPPHWLAENPHHHISSSSSSPPWSTVELHGRSASANPLSRRRADAEVEAGQKAPTDELHCKFAPLPPGKKRSNSIAIGVAARASMIKGQGAPSATPHPQYAGPQMWYQQGGAVPPDVYTYKDLTSAWKKLFSKVKRRPSTSSRSSAESGAMERDGKGKSKEIEHIEEASEGEDDLEGSDEEEDDSNTDDEEEVRGRSLGLTLESASDASLASSATSTSNLSSPDTPADDEHHIPLPAGADFAKPISKQSKGKGVDRRA